MARKIDEDKIARIKEATMRTIVEKGIESTTIAMIAKKANVSGGYLYRTYAGKQDLINELFHDKVDFLYNELENLLALNQNSIKPLLQTFIKNRISYFLKEPNASKFFYQLLHNENFFASDEIKHKSADLIIKIKNIGVKSGEISEDTTVYQLHYHILVYAVDYINFTRKNIFGEQEVTINDVDKLTKNILNILK
ncbi:TetR/AcrR family transcriptional regulator [Polaribacter sp. Z014]|uniref:TetR/AcrR family transcriptional regulator n=1 Tax=unclassified Polaribacter TaxID=196858 RepID=UPI00193BC7B4|nr:MULTISPECIES: TetR/AcrR family transcriptional regulator [unclassified Polaribacter]MCL7764247.1 TetR/AcrR family transcriptional regulator [Polaribacter sp. Z014]QVY65828.1 TetR/AcrR family transcriptional regulator [Polaribacter sp. Q13]